jgi:hypothetical protein
MSTEIKAVTHTEKVIAGEVQPVTHLEKVIDKYGGGGGGGGFTPTQAQLDAMNSGINSTKVQQIETNETNISNQQDTTAQGGNGYAIINGIRLYVSSTAPTGDIPDGSVGVGW